MDILREKQEAESVPAAIADSEASVASPKQEAEAGLPAGEAGWAWDAIVKWSLYMLVFLTPLFFLPWGSLLVVQNKQFLSTVLVVIALIAWLAKSIAAGKIVWRKSPLNIAALFLAVVWGLSTIFSQRASLSVGFSAYGIDSFVNIIKYVLVFFLIGATLREKKDVWRALFFFLFSLATLSVFTALKLLNINFLPWDFAKAVDFNTIGTMNGLAVFLGFGLSVIAGLLMTGEAGKEKEPEKLNGRLSRGLQPTLVVLAVILVVELLLINFKGVWWATAGAMLFLTAFGLMRELQEMKVGNKQALKIQNLILPISILAIAVMLLLVRLPISNLVKFSAEVSPSFSATYDIAKETMGSGGAKTILLGTGPATFSYNYGLYRAGELNQTIFWGVKFSQGYNFLLTALATTGILGLAALIFLIAAFLWQAFVSLRLSGDGHRKNSGLPVVFIGATVFLLVSGLVYPLNFSLLLFSFIALGLLVATNGESKIYSSSEAERVEKFSTRATPEASAERAGSNNNFRNISLLVSPQRTMIVSLILIMLIVGSVSALYLASQKYIASLYYSSGVAEFNRTGDVDAAMIALTKAINLDATHDQYWQTLSQLFLVKTKKILDDPAWQSAGTTALEDLRSQFQVAMAQTVDAAKRATQENPLNSSNWSNLGSVYENVLPFVSGGEEFMIGSYQKAAALEPKNPALRLDLGRGHLVVSNKIKTQIEQLSSSQNQKVDKAQIDSLAHKADEELTAAVSELDKAIQLKPDYSPAHFLLVQTYSLQGNIEKAIARSIDYRNLNPKVSGAAFQLGFLFYKNNQFEEAKSELERAVDLNPDYSNARYFLGLIHDRGGDKQKAKEQFEKIILLNPENQEVKKILDNLNNGKAALEGITPPAPAPEERTAAPVPETGGANEPSIK